MLYIQINADSNFSTMMMSFGQFIDHDLDLALDTPSKQSFLTGNTHFRVNSIFFMAANYVLSGNKETN